MHVLQHNTSKGDLKEDVSLDEVVVDQVDKVVGVLYL